MKKELQSEKAKKSWESLDAFTKGSNYSSALHDIQKYELLNKAGIDVSGMAVRENEQRFNELSEIVRNSLQEIEHIRYIMIYLL